MAEKPYCLSCDTSAACHAANKCLDGNMPKKASPLSAGAVPELPIVAWENWNKYTGECWGPLTPQAPAQATIAAQAAEIGRLKRERDKLKAKQVADVEAVMRLADVYAKAAAEYQYDSTGLTEMERDAAREALRSHLTKDRT